MHGACSAYLLSQLNQQPASVQLQSSYGIVLREKDTTLLKSLPYNLFQRDEWIHLLTEAGDGTILMETQLLDWAQGIGERLELDAFADDDQLMSLYQIKEPYRSLLDKQLAQLKTY